MAMSGQTIQTDDRQADDSQRSAFVNNRLLLNGGALAVIGWAITVTGTSMVAGAILSAIRQWSQSEQRRELTAKARIATAAATAAATTAWKQQHPGSIRLPDTASPSRTTTPV